MHSSKKQEMGASHHWYGSLWRIGFSLTFPSWCGRANIIRCIEVGHLYQCLIHPEHYSRKPGGCIQCQEEWQRQEQARKNQNRANRAERKAKDTGNANFFNARNGKRPDTIAKPVKARQTEMPNARPAQKPGKWSTNKQEISSAHVGPPTNHTPNEDQDQDQDHGKGKGKALGPATFKAKKNWRDGRIGSSQVPHW